MLEDEESSVISASRENVLVGNLRKRSAASSVISEPDGFRRTLPQCPRKWVIPDDLQDNSEVEHPTYTAHIEDGTEKASSRQARGRHLTETFGRTRRPTELQGKLQAAGVIPEPHCRDPSIVWRLSTRRISSHPTTTTDRSRLRMTQHSREYGEKRIDRAHVQARLVWA